MSFVSSLSRPSLAFLISFFRHRCQPQGCNRLDTKKCPLFFTGETALLSTLDARPRFLLCRIRQLPIKSHDLDTNPNLGSLPDPNSLAKQFIFIERNLIPHHTVGCPSQFVCKGLGGKSTIALGHFSLVESSGLLAKPHCMVSGFDIGPGNILVAIYSVCLRPSYCLIVEGLARLTLLTRRSATR